MKATIFNIQKFSLHDGPGIRTVVFFKGCPLRCRWCSNPESQSFDQSIPWEENTGVRREQAARMSVQEVLDVCLQDLDFYEESGGGVTLSGGEPLGQPEFAIALLKELKGRHIHTAIETTGCVGSGILQDALPYIDLLLFDVKHWEDARHREGTGAGNGLILQNMEAAVRAGKDVLPRLPVIPGFNDSLADAAGFARLLKEVGAARVQLLPFHQFGEGKYAALGKAYAYADVPALHEEDLKEFQQALLDKGINAFF